MTGLAAYLVAFAIDLWTSLHGAPPREHGHRRSEMDAVAEDVAGTDAGALEALTLMNVAAWESGYERSAVGKAGERGPFQIMPPARSYGAAEALRRLREQGILGYMGCARSTARCEAMAERRTFPAELFLWAHDPPHESAELMFCSE
jgi:hypothetical protein